MLNLQFVLNCILFSAIDYISYELIYRIILNSVLYILSKNISTSELQDFTVCINTAEAVSITAIAAKNIYNNKYYTIFFLSDQRVLLYLYRGYTILSSVTIKYLQQYAELFIVVRKIERLIYKLKLS